MSTSELKTYRAVVSLDGSFEIGQRYFDWDVGYQYNRNELTATATGNLHKKRVRDAVGPSFPDPATGKVMWPSGRGDQRLHAVEPAGALRQKRSERTDRQ